MKRKQKLILLIIVLSLVLVCTGLSFAFFTSITNNESASTIYAKGGTMSIRYANGSGNIVMENIYPKEEAWVNKIFTVTGNNSTELDMEYRIYLETTSNGFNAGDLTYSISGTSTNQADKLVEKANQPLAKAGVLLLGKGIFKSKIATHSYNLRIFYKETNEEQNNGQGKSFTGYVRIDNGSSLAYDTLYNENRKNSSNIPAFNGPITKEQVEKITFNITNTVPSNAVYSWDAGEKQDGTIMAYTLDENNNGLYELYIGQDGKVSTNITSYLLSGYSNANIIDVTNLDTSKSTNMYRMFSKTKATTIKGLNTLDTSNVTEMAYMFEETSFADIDVSNFNTSKVRYMSFMFQKSDATSIVGLDKLDTSNVTDMALMFYQSGATELNLANFNTSKVRDMRSMFANSNANTIIGLENFNTQNVTNMQYMFFNSKASTINLSNFNTTNVTDMRGMFQKSSATTLNLSNFNTSNVTNMYGMFYNSSATTLDLSSFDTSNVKNMQNMFNESKATTLDLSSFRTPKVTTMASMFCNSSATSIDVSNFDTTNVTSMAWMFVNSKVTALDLSSFDMTNVKDVNNMFGNVKATTAYARTQSDADKLNSSSNKPSKLNFTVKP